MEKRVTLKLYGDVRQGFQAVLEIDLGNQPEVEVVGQLPPASELIQCFRQWEESFHALGQTNRAIKPKGVKLAGSLGRRKQECQRLAKDLQQAFNTWLRAESFAGICQQWSEKVSTQDSVRVIIRAEDASIWQLPWHLWDLLDRYLQLEIGFSVLSYNAQKSVPPPEDEPLKILAILGHSEGIDVERDRQLLERLPGATTTFLVEPQRRILSHQLWDQRWDILFFAGHSQTEGDAGRIYLNQTDSLSLEELKAGLRQSVNQGLQLAIFNSCDGLGLAQELKSLHIPYLIIMRQPVPDRVAQEFLKYFLQTFSGGESFYTAAQQARQRLEGLQDDFPCASWLPMIWQNPLATPLTWRVVRSPFQKRFERFWKPLGIVMGMSLAIAIGMIGIRATGILQSTEVWAFDQLLQLRPEEEPDRRLLIVEMTETDLQTYGYPIPDRVLAQLLQKLETAQPRVIGLDILRDLPQEPGHQELVQQLQKSDRLVAICQHGQLDAIGTPPPPAVAAEQVGFSDVVLDPSDVIRRHLLYLSPENLSGCQSNIALSLLLVLEYLEPQGISLEVTVDDYLKIGPLQLPRLDQPAGGYQTTSFADLAGYQILLNYRQYDGSFNNIAKRVSLSEVLQGRVDLSTIQNHIILIGVTASSIKDDFNAPNGEKLRGLIIHAQMVSQLLSAVLDGRSLLWVWDPWGEGIWIVGWSIMGGLMAWYFDRYPRQLNFYFVLSKIGIAVIIFVVVIFAVCYGFILFGGWIPLISPAIASLLSYLGSSAYLRSQVRHPINTLENSV